MYFCIWCMYCSGIIGIVLVVIVTATTAICPWCAKLKWSHVHKKSGDHWSFLAHRIQHGCWQQGAVRTLIHCKLNYHTLLLLRYFKCIKNMFLVHCAFVNVKCSVSTGVLGHFLVHPCSSFVIFEFQLSCFSLPGYLS